jgi:dipeptidyl aminopeptidase/acylaminoacyl peptidase
MGWWALNEALRRWLLQVVATFSGLICTVTCSEGANPRIEGRHKDSMGEIEYAVGIRDRSGVQQPLLQSLRESWHTGGGTAISHDGTMAVFSILAPPQIDARHPTVEPTRGVNFGDGTPSFRRGNKLMIAHIAGASLSDSTARPALLSPTESWNPSWSRDDRRVAYFSNEGGKAQLWVYEVAAERRRLVSDLQVNALPLATRDLPCWSADGTRVFVSVVTSLVHDGASPRANPYFRAGDVSDARSMSIQYGNPDVATSAIASIDVDTGQITLLPANGPINLLHALSVSPSGQWLATLTDDYQLSVIHLPENHLYRLGSVDALSYRADDYAGPYWSPADDTFVYLSGGRLFMLNLTQGFSSPRELAGNLGGLPWHYDHSAVSSSDNLNPPAYTRDGRHLVGLLLVNELVQLLVVPLDGGPAALFPMRNNRRVQRDPGEDIQMDMQDGIDLLRVRANVLWQPRKDHLYLNYTDYETAESVIDDVDIRTGVKRTVKRWHAQLQLVGRYSSNDNDVTVLYEDLKTPGSLYRLSSNLVLSRAPLIDLTIADTMLAPLREASVSTFTTVVPTRSGVLRNVTTAVILPGGTNRRPFPAIVSIYPGSQAFWDANRFPDGQTYLPIAALLAEGYAVVLPHVLGMAPYEPTIEQVETTGVIDSLLPQLYHASSLGFVDIRHLAVIGFSQGGHAAVAVTTATRLFRASVSVNGVRFAPTESTLFFPTDPNKNVDIDQFVVGLHRLLDNAPYLRADQIVTPVLLVHGASDSRSSSSELMADALRKAGTRVEFIQYPNLGHDYELWPNGDRNDFTKRMISFLDANVK